MGSTKGLNRVVKNKNNICQGLVCGESRETHVQVFETLDTQGKKYRTQSYVNLGKKYSTM